LVVTFDLSSENLISILGALFDIAGAAILAWSFVFVRASDIVRQSSSGYGFTPALMRMFSEQKVDAAFGLGFLLVGFTLQAIAGDGYKTSHSVVFWIGLATLVGLLAVYIALRRPLTKAIFEWACRSTRRPDGSPTEAQISEYWTNAHL
jgi:hypothetical protein